MRVIIISVLFIFPTILSSYGNEIKNEIIVRKHNIVLEIGGSSVPYTIGWERVLYKNSRKEIRGKIGLGLIKTMDCRICNNDDIADPDPKIEEILSFELLNLRGKKRGKLEYGIGFGITNAFNFTNTFLLSGRIGYRFISINNGLNFGIGLNPTWKIYGYELWNKFFLMPGLKVGFEF